MSELSIEPNRLAMPIGFWKRRSTGAGLPPALFGVDPAGRPAPSSTTRSPLNTWPLANDLLFGRRRPTCGAFDLLICHGIDLSPMPLDRRGQGALGEHAEGVAATNGVVGLCAASGTSPRGKSLAISIVAILQRRPLLDHACPQRRFGR